MPIKLKKSYTGQDRDELTSTIVLGAGLSLSHDGDGIPILDAASSGVAAPTELGPQSGGASVAPNFTTSPTVKMGVMSGTVTINTPTGGVEGGTYALLIRQNGGGQIAWSGSFRWPGGSAAAPTMVTSGSTVVTFIYLDSLWHGVGTNDFKA